MITSEIFIFELKYRKLRQVYRQKAKHKDFEEAKKEIKAKWTEHSNKYGKFASITTKSKKTVYQNYSVINDVFKLKNKTIKRVYYNE